MSFYYLLTTEYLLRNIEFQYIKYGNKSTSVLKNCKVKELKLVALKFSVFYNYIYKSVSIVIQQSK